jgi:hypothetical protein
MKKVWLKNKCWHICRFKVPLCPQKARRMKMS